MHVGKVQLTFFFFFSLWFPGCEHCLLFLKKKIYFDFLGVVLYVCVYVFFFCLIRNDFLKINLGDFFFFGLLITFLF